MMPQTVAEPTTQVRSATVVEFMVGPAAKGPRRCLHCREEFKSGEPWQRVTAPDNSYAVGIHSTCLTVPGAEQ